MCIVKILIYIYSSKREGAKPAYYLSINCFKLGGILLGKSISGAVHSVTEHFIIGYRK
jgi:hypothetical protein